MPINMKNNKNYVQLTLNYFNKNRTFGMIKPDAYTHIGKIIDAIEKTDFTISNIKMTKFSL